MVFNFLDIVQRPTQKCFVDATMESAATPLDAANRCHVVGDELFAKSSKDHCFRGMESTAALYMSSFLDPSASTY